jgi:hypothetical protein
MRRTGIVLLLLALAAPLAGCATTERGLQGEAGPVAWEVVEARQSEEANGARMRWQYTVLLRNRGVTVVNFETLEVGSQAVQPGDMWGGLSSQPFVRRLDPNSELRVTRNDSWECSRCGAGERPRFFRDGIIRSLTFKGQDAQGMAIRVVVRIGLNSSFGART